MRYIKTKNFLHHLLMSKSGLIGLTKWIAAKYSKNKFTCNMLSPSELQVIKTSLF